MKNSINCSNTVFCGTIFIINAWGFIFTQCLWMAVFRVRFLKCWIYQRVRSRFTWSAWVSEDLLFTNSCKNTGSKFTVTLQSIDFLQLCITIQLAHCCGKMGNMQHVSVINLQTVYSSHMGRNDSDKRSTNITKKIKVLSRKTSNQIHKLYV